jgi:hypothetical protein
MQKWGNHARRERATQKKGWGRTMTDEWVNWIKRQLGGSLEMLQVAIETAHDEMWDHKSDDPRFWRICAHVVFYIDFYFSTFKPNAVNIPETYRHPDFLLKYAETRLEDIEDAVVTKEDMIRFLDVSRSNLRSYFDNNISTQLSERSGFEWLKMTKGELLLYNMRHIMEHTAILNQILKKHGLKASKWRGIGEI